MKTVFLESLKTKQPNLFLLSTIKSSTLTEINYLGDIALRGLFLKTTEPSTPKRLSLNLSNKINAVLVYKFKCRVNYIALVLQRILCVGRLC